MGYLFYVSLLGYAIGMKTLLPKMRIGSAVLSAICGMVFVSYVLVILCGLYRIGAYFVVGAGFLFGFIGILFLLSGAKRNRLSFGNMVKKQLRDYCTVSFFVFFTISFGGAFLIRGMETFPNHDNYSFWGRAVREMWVFESSYFNGSSNISFSDYCPAISSLQYCIVRVFGWKNEYLCYVLIGIIAASFAAIYDRFHWRNAWCAAFGVSACLILYPLAAKTLDFDELYVDGPIAMMAAAMMLLWVERDDNSISSILPIVMTAFVLVTAKLYTGLIFAMVLLIAMLLYYIKNRDTMQVSIIVFMILAIAFAYFSWSAYYNYFAEVQYYEAQNARNEYLGMPIENGEKPPFLLSYFIRGNPRNSSFANNVDIDVIRNNWDAFAVGAGSFFLDRLECAESPYLTMFSALAFTACAMTIVFFLTSGETRRCVKYCYQLTRISLTTYAIGMIVTFLIVQPDAINAVVRYASTGLVLLQNVLFYYLSRLLSEKKKTAIGFAGLLLAGMAVSISPIKLKDAYLIEHNYYSAQWAQNGIDSVKQWVGDDDRILYIENRDPKGKWLSKRGTSFCYQYYAFPNYATAVFHPYGKTDGIEDVDAAWLESCLTKQCANKLIVMSDDAAYQERYADILDIDVSKPQPWVVAVSVDNGEFFYSLIN